MRKVCMVVHSNYPADPRVRREAEAIIDRGWAVDIVCLRGDNELPAEHCGAANVYRLPVRRHRGSGLSTYLLEYMTFFILAALHVTRYHLRRRYDVIHVHNMPDFLVFLALIPRLLGARVVLDIHDLVPELYALKFGGSYSHPAVRLTRWIERRSTGFADHVITAGEPFRRRLIERNVPPNKVTVIMNSADPRLFQPVKTGGPMISDKRRFTLIYHGGLFERYGLDLAVRAVDQLRDQVPGLRLVIYGEGESSTTLRDLVKELRLEEQVHLGGYVPIDHIPDLIRAADLGVVPYRNNQFTEMLYPTKAFEYIVMGIPVIISRFAAVVDLFPAVPDMFFESENVDDLAARILALYQDPQRRRELLSASQRAYAPISWESQREKLSLLMQQLVRNHDIRPHVR